MRALAKLLVCGMADQNGAPRHGTAGGSLVMLAVRTTAKLTSEVLGDEGLVLLGLGDVGAQLVGRQRVGEALRPRRPPVPVHRQHVRRQLPVLRTTGPARLGSSWNAWGVREGRLKLLSGTVVGLGFAGPRVLRRICQTAISCVPCGRQPGRG